MVSTAAAPALGLFLRKLMYRSSLSAEEQQAILSLPAVSRHFAAHTPIVDLGEHVDHACLVADGFVARFAMFEDGRRQHIALHIAGDMADLYSLLLPAAPSPLLALTATEIFQIPHRALKDIAFDYPAIATAFWRDCVVDGNIIAQWLVNVGRRDARSRIAHFLCEMAVRSNHIGRYQSGRFPFPITQEHLADAVSLTPVHVNRSLKALRQEQLVQIAGGKVVVLDWNGLVQAAGFESDYLQLPALRDGRSQAKAR